MKKRYAYHLDLAHYRSTATRTLPAVAKMRRPKATDIGALAELMIDAYRDTIDYDGETIEDAMTEVDSYFSGRDGRTVLECSNHAMVEDVILCACLVGWWRAKELPLIAYLMTRSSWKNRGLGTAALAASLQDLNASGYERVAAVITEGNLPSEIIHGRAGFARRQE